MTKQDKAEPEATEGLKPYWLPAGTGLGDLPEELRVAFEGILTPAYKALVMAARPGLEQSTGATIVSVLWLEILQSVELGERLMGANGDPERLEKLEKSIDRLMRLVGAKMKASEFLLRLHAHRRKVMADSGPAAPPPESAPLWPASPVAKEGA